MTAPQPDPSAREQYLAEANAELDAMLGEVGKLECAAPAAAGANLACDSSVIAVIAVALFAIGMVLMRGRRPGRMALTLTR